MKMTFLVSLIFLSVCVSVAGQTVADIKGEYAVYQVIRIKENLVLKFPYKGVSLTYKIDPISDSTAKVAIMTV